MCTVTWMRSLEAAGYDLLFNRDESRTRGPELGPEPTRQGDVTYLAPRDSDHGGTWLAVNDHGLTVCLLNGYVPSRGPSPPTWRSRGLLVSDLADAADSCAVRERLSPKDLATYQPFVLLALDQGGGQVLRWDGVELTAHEASSPEGMLSSSGHDQTAVQHARAARLAELRAEVGGTTPALLERFMGDHGQGPSAYTPCMHRTEAATRSQCQVRVRPGSVELVHVPGPPCRTAAGQAQSLPRQTSGVGA